MSTRSTFAVFVVTVAFSSLLFGDNSSGIAILHTDASTSSPDKSVLVNGLAAPDGSALFSGDRIETNKGAGAEIVASGVELFLQPSTIAQMEKDEIVLEHGSIRIMTMNGFRLVAGCLLTTPLDRSSRTDYAVTSVNGSVTISASLKDVQVSLYSVGRASATKAKSSVSGTLVAENHQTTRPERCGALAPASPDAVGAIMNSPYVKWPAVVVIGGVVCEALCRNGQPASPVVP